MTHTTKKVQSIALELKRFEEITLQLEKHIEINDVIYWMSCMV